LRRPLGNCRTLGDAVLVICNGAMKGGSTWTVQLVRQFGVFHRIPSDYQNAQWKNSSLSPEYLERINELSFHHYSDYFCKQHFHRKRFAKVIINDPRIKMINIVRDLRDMAVSWIFHQKRNAQIPGEVEIGELFASKQLDEWLENIIRHQRNWHGKSALYVPHLMSYERLHVDFDASLRDLIGFLQHPTIAYSKEMSRTMFRQTNRREVASGDCAAHIRRGYVGDYQNYLSEEQEAKLCGLAIELGYSEIKDQMRRDFPQLEPYLQVTDIGLPGGPAWRGAAA